MIKAYMAESQTSPRRALPPNLEKAVRFTLDLVISSQFSKAVSLQPKLKMLAEVGNAAIDNGDSAKVDEFSSLLREIMDQYEAELAAGTLQLASEESQTTGQ